MWKDKKVLLGITGSIAAYKTASLVRLLVKEGAEVQVICTEAALAFITPLTLSTLSKREVLSSYADKESGTWNNHVHLAKWADIMIIAPASAHTLSKMAYGLCDNLLMATYLSTTCPVWVAPAMDLDMYKHPALVRNLEILHKQGVHIIEAGFGELASGLVGQGRMAEPEEILSTIGATFEMNKLLKDNTLLITAGPTREALDPVRFITNHSSGKMGYALAASAHALGAKVHLVSGPVSLSPPPGVVVHKVESAEEMMEVSKSLFDKVDGCIFCAAVADYRPVSISDQKIKKDEETFTLAMTKNPDIALEFGKHKKPQQISIGFALETHDVLAYGKSKLEKKNFDAVVINNAMEEGAGFGTETNKVVIYTQRGALMEIPMATKSEIANHIMDVYLKIKHEKS